MTHLETTAIFIGDESRGNGFKWRSSNSPWHLHFEIVASGAISRICVRNAFGEQFKYYDNLTKFLKDWQPVDA